MPELILAFCNISKERDGSFYLFKGYLCYKTIFFHKVALDVKLMVFLFEEKNNVLFSRYLYFYVFLK